MDGLDLLPRLADATPLLQRDLYWEMGEQTAVRRGPWKLVLKGQLVEEPGYTVQDATPVDQQPAPAQAPSVKNEVHLANLEADMAERHNLKDQHPDLVAELTAAAETWRQQIETRWQSEWLPRVQGTTTHPNR